MLSKKTILFLAITLFVAILVGNMCHKRVSEALTVRSNTGSLRTGGGRMGGRMGGRRVASGGGLRISGRGRRGGRMGGRMGGGGRGHAYWHRRRWAGPHRGYSYGYGPSYYNWWPFYTTAAVATVPLEYGCKSGCVNLGNGEWGCQFPGDGITQCQFSADCEACDDRVWWRPSTWFY